MDEEIYNTTWSLLESNPALREDIESVLKVDQKMDRWEFDDIDLDSGTFGKLVDRRVVKKNGSKYTVTDQTAVKEALRDYQSGTKQTTSHESVGSTDSSSSSSVTGQVRSYSSNARNTVSPYVQVINWNVIGLITALLAVIGMRSLTAYDVIREDNIVSPANDPYYYRYVQAEMLEHAEGITDIGTLTELGQEGTRPLTHVFNWWIPELFGESQTIADWTAALLPVTLAVLTGAMIYMLAVKITEDARVGVLAVVFYAIAPVHLVYTSLGFLEHRPHQYLWLVIMVFTLAWFAVDLRRRLEQTPSAEIAVQAHLNDQRTWVITGIFTLAVALTPHFWGGAPLHFIPVAIYIALRVLLDARNSVSPTRSLAPVLVGLGAGGILTYIPHTVWGWRETFVVLTPLLVFIGAAAIALYAEFGMQRGISATTLVVGEGAIGIGSILAFRMLMPEEFASAQERADDLFFREGAVETGSLLGSVLRPLYQIGPSFYIGIVGIIVGVLIVRRNYRPSWLLLTTFGVYYLILATLQIRFAAQFVLFISIFGALGTLYALSKFEFVNPVRGVVDATTDTSKTQLSGLFREVQSVSRPKSIWTGFIVAVVILALISGAFVSLGPILDDITHEEQYDAAMEINEHAESIDREYPENFVLSQWGDSRMYNYFVNGESRSYGYAHSNYEDFLGDSDPADTWYDEFEGDVGYVVVPPLPTQAQEQIIYDQLWEDIGLDESSTSHYRFLGDMQGTRIFAVVDGATITVEGADDEVFAQLQGEVIPNREYGISGSVDNDTGEVTVAYEGSYVVGDTERQEIVEINESQVYEGDTINVSLE